MLGATYRDTITGFEGVCICISEWLHGCRRLTLQPKAMHEGKPVESWTFDEPQLEVVPDAATVPGTSDTGGPRPEPRRGR